MPRQAENTEKKSEDRRQESEYTKQKIITKTPAVAEAMARQAKERKHEIFRQACPPLEE
jgi:hypothetical protein